MNFVLCVLSPSFAVCRLDPQYAIPAWALGGSFFTVTRTDEELSIVCEEAVIDPEHGLTHLKIEPGWRCLKLHGPIPFSTTGVIASLTSALAGAGISVSPIATYGLFVCEGGAAAGCDCGTKKCRARRELRGLRLNVLQEFGDFLQQHLRLF